MVCSTRKKLTNLSMRHYLKNKVNVYPDMYEESVPNFFGWSISFTNFWFDIDGIYDVR